MGWTGYHPSIGPTFGAKADINKPAHDPFFALSKTFAPKPVFSNPSPLNLGLQWTIFRILGY